MEKIYMEEYNQKPKRGSGFSVVLSFAVAVFAIVSLVVVGFNQISYAAPSPYTGTTLTFKYAEDADVIRLNARDADGKAFLVPIYLADVTDFASGTAVPLLCIEHFADTDNGSTYTKDGEVNDDPGLIYILNKSGVLGGTGIYSNREDVENRYIETYATQVAIWVYMYEKYYLGSPTTYVKYSLANYAASDNTAEALDHYNTIINATSLEGIGTSFGPKDITNLFSEKIRPVVDAAKSSTAIKKVVINGGTSISKGGDDSFYQTSSMSVSSTPSNDLINFTVSVTGIDGAYVVDKDGNNKNTFTTSETFFVRVPVDKVTTSVASINVHVSALLDHYLAGSYFKNGEYQRLVLVTNNQGTVDADKSIQVVGTPDTGMNKAQTIYFIGLIVLLCGVGIIYANAKHAEVDE